MVKILLFCNAGMSTSMLVSKMRDAAKNKEIEATIDAFPESQMEKKLDDVDVVFLGPQVKFLLSKAKGICEPKGIPVEVINTIDYGMMNGEKVLERGIELAGK